MRLARLAFLALGCASFAVPAHAQGCAKGHHSIQIENRSIDLDDYSCTVNGAPGGLRVGFFHLSEVLAGTLVMGSRIPLLDQIVGPVRFVENDLYKEVKYLFANFGNSLSYDSPERISWSLTLTGDSRNSVDLNLSTAPPGTAVKVWYLSRLFKSLQSDSVLLKAPSQVILNTDHWPPDFNMTFSCPSDEKKKFIECTTIWKYIGPNDFTPITQGVEEVYRRAESVLRKEDEDTRKRAKDGMSDFTRNFALYRYLAQHDLPPDFLFLMSNTMDEGCYEANWVLGYSPKPLSLDVAVIENTSGQPLTIEKFFGVERTDGTFRPATGAGKPGDAATPLGLAPVVLPPGEKIALPLRAIFENDPEPSWAKQPDPDSDYRESAAQTFQKIRSFPARSQFTANLGGFNRRQTVRKTRESFLAHPPAVPQLVDYAYGPELGLSGLGVAGQVVTFKEGSAQDITTEAASPPFPDREAALTFPTNRVSTFPPEVEGSCPVLYVWRDDVQDWMYHGKVLHLAQGAEREMTDRIVLPSVRTRFRIAEEEPEASFIRHMRLHLTLRDGRSIQLLPRQPASFVVRADTAVDVEFDLPDGVRAEQVVRTELEIAGHYRRYSDMLSAAGEVPPIAVGTKTQH